MSYKNLKLLLLSIFLGAFIAPQLSQVVFADHELSGRAIWIDAYTLKYGDNIYTDRDPFDGNRNYKATASGQGSHCGEIDVSSDKKKATIYLQIVNSVGNCENHAPSNHSDSKNDDGKHSYELNLDATQKSSITAYRIDNERIFMPWCREYTYNFGVELDTKSVQNCTFKLFPSDVSNYSEDIFPRFQNTSYQFGGDVDEELSGEWVDTGASKQYYKACRTGVVGCKTGSVDIQLANNGNTVSPPDNYGFQNGQPPGSGGENGDGSGENGNADNSCEAQGGPMGWILCPLSNILGEALEWLDAQLTKLLLIDNSLYTNGSVRDAWVIMRTFAFSLLIPIMLVMVVSTALGFDFISAYTVKTALPRMVIATIFIAVSFDVLVFVIDMIQNIGVGVQNIILGPFGLDSSDGIGAVLPKNLASSSAQIGVAGALIGTGITSVAGASFIGVLFAIAGLAASGALMLLLVFILLLFRQTIIVFLLIVSPLAILPWIFPGRDRLFSLWNKTFWLMLAFFPAIMAAIAVGKAMAAIITGEVNP